MARLRNVRVIIITGLSGSGKSTALRAFEDLGFFCVDNLPVDLLPPFLELREQGSPEAVKVALVMDLREPNFLKHYPQVLENLKATGFRPEIIYLEATTDALIQRFSQTRRSHPLGVKGSVVEAILEEQRALEDLKARADLVIDTSNLSVHELKARIGKTFSVPLAQRGMLITLISFGFKYGIPHEADIVMDVRFLPNPYFVNGLREKTGKDPEVAAFLNRWEETDRFLDRFSSMLHYLLPLYEKEGKAYLTIGVGCTGGRHRSVAMVEWLRRRLEGTKHELTISHRDINLE